VRAVRGVEKRGVVHDVEERGLEERGIEERKATVAAEPEAVARSDEAALTDPPAGEVVDRPVVWRPRHHRDDAAARGDDVLAATADAVVRGQMVREPAEE
jgi:hypothetical protein